MDRDVWIWKNEIVRNYAFNDTVGIYDSISLRNRRIKRIIKMQILRVFINYVKKDGLLYTVLPRIIRASFIGSSRYIHEPRVLMIIAGFTITKHNIEMVRKIIFFLYRDIPVCVISSSYLSSWIFLNIWYEYFFKQRYTNLLKKYTFKTFAIKIACNFLCQIYEN